MDQKHNRAPALATCTEEERQEAMGRLAVLRSHINDGVPLPEAARDAGVPFRSVQRWLARYRATGLAGLGFQALLASCHAGHDGDHLKYRIMPSPMRIPRRGNDFMHCYPA